MLDIQRPYAFFILLILIFFSAYDLFRYKKVAKSLGVANLMNNFQKNKSFRRFKISIILRTVLRFLACAFAVFAFAGILLLLITKDPVLASAKNMVLKKVKK